MKAFIVFCLLTTQSYAQVLSVGKLLQKVEMDEVPAFFFKVNPSGTMISYTVPTTNNPAAPGQNKIINLLNQQTVNVPGPHDPVFIGDSGLIVTPTTNHSQYEIYDVTELWENKTNMLLPIKSLVGYYQSAAVMKKEGSLYGLRVIAERGAKQHTLVDFTYDASLRGQTSAFSLDDNKKAVLCPSTDFKLPMLSKDGRFVGGIDNMTKTSGVWAIHDDLTCTKVYDLGLKVGKINFNNDSTKVTYHIYKKVGALDSDESTNYIPHPDKSFVANVYVLNLATGATTRVTGNETGNAMYPDFTQDGRLVFITHPHEASEKVSFSMVELPAGL